MGKPYKLLFRVQFIIDNYIKKTIYNSLWTYLKNLCVCEDYYEL